MVHLSHKEASRTIAALRPQYRDAAAILSALKESAERLSDGGAIVITTALTGKSSKLPLHITDALFRIGQEAISNAIQHADCKVLIINLGLSKRETQLEVQDDGRGYLGQTVNEGLGIATGASNSPASRTNNHSPSIFRGHCNKAVMALQGSGGHKLAASLLAR